MATYLVHRDPSRSQDKNSNGRHAVLVAAGDAASAIGAARDACRTSGETRVRDTWLATLVAEGDPSVAPVWFEGDAVLPGGTFRGS